MGGCTFNYLIEVTPPLFSLVFPQASCLRQAGCPYVPSVVSATPDIHSNTSPEFTSIQPSVLAPSYLARSDPEPVFVKKLLLASSDIAIPVMDPASVFNETARPPATASAVHADARTSGLLAPQLGSAQLQPALDTRSFLVPAPAGSDPITNLADITGDAMYSAPDINTFIKSCQFHTIAAPPSLSNHL